MKNTCILLFFCVLWTACETPEESPLSSEPTAPVFEVRHVEVLELSPTSFNDIVELTGTVEAKQDVTVSAKTTGILESIVELGQTVSPGEIVARAEDDLLLAAVAQAEALVRNAKAALEIAEESFNRQQPLLADSIISPLEFSLLETTFQQAQSFVDQQEAFLKQAKSQLEYAYVRSPIAGKVETRYVEAGELLSPGTPILRLVDVRNVHVAAGIPERYAGEIEIGTPADISLPTAGILPRTGRVVFAGSVIDPDSRSFEVHIDVNNADGKMKPEMIARLAILRLTIEDAIVIPGNTVTRTENGLSVFVVEQHDGNPVAQMRTVTLGAEYANQVVILNGLSAGERVVVRGQSTLGDGDLVTIDETYSELNEYGSPVMSSLSNPSPEPETES